MSAFLIVAGSALMALGSPQMAYADSLIPPAVIVPLSTSTVRAAVEEEFGTSSVMVRIAGCESSYRQFDELGQPLKGDKDPDDTGVFQINKHYHFADADKMGIDITTLEGNLQYAHLLYQWSGTSSWLASKSCWG